MTHVKPITTNVNRLMYGLLVILSGYFLLDGEMEMSMSNMGIALIFDPFNEEVPWNKRPRYQRVWLIAHTVIVFCLLGTLLYSKFV